MSQNWKKVSSRPIPNSSNQSLLPTFLFTPHTTMSLYHSNHSPLSALDDTRIKRIRPLIPPQILIEDYPLTVEAAATIAKGRQDAEAIVKQQDDRLVVVVGPCSVHDVVAGIEYGELAQRKDGTVVDTTND